MTTEDRWMALDVGRKRIGIALSDPLKILARPLLCLRRKTMKQDVERILDLSAEHGVSRIVVGLPRHLDGRRSPITEMVEAVVAELTRQSSLDLQWSDESLSSKEAEAVMGELNVPIRERRRLRDAYAAAIILQRFIEEGASKP